MTAIQRPTLALGACMGTPAHDWRVSAWAEIEADADNPGKGRAAVAFYCARCLSQVDAAVLYAERPADEEAPPAGEIDAKLALATLHDMHNEAAQATAVAEAGSFAADEAERRRAALEWAISQAKPVAP
jgi:hypothetical protein